MFHLPSASDWKLTAVAFAALAAVATSFGIATGLFEFKPEADIGAIARTAAIALILPALLEELVFRGPLIWIAARRPTAMAPAAVITLVLFVLWHPFNATFVLTEAQNTFFDWRFLTIAALLGVATTWLALRTRSLWPPIVLHWLAVVGWKAFLGAPAFL